VSDPITAQPDITHYMTLPYTRILRLDEVGDVIATIAELRGCMAHGATEAEALENLTEARRVWLEHALERGLDIPMPEPAEEMPSGKWLVRAPKSLHLRANRVAKKDDVSLNQVTVSALTEYVTRREEREHTRAMMDHHREWVRHQLEGVATEADPAPRSTKYLRVYARTQRVRGDVAVGGHVHQSRHR